jgi:hypothetical protein
MTCPSSSCWKHSIAKAFYIIPIDAGILPLSANTLFINKMVSEYKGIANKQVKGRLYDASAAGEQENERLSAKAKEVLASLSFRIVG